MRIGFDVAQTCGEKAGCSWYADSLIGELARLAPQHEFFLYHHFGGWINDATLGGTTIDAQNVSAPLAQVGRRRAARFWRDPERYWQELGAPEVVHANCFQAPKLHRAKLVYTVYDVSFWAVPEYTLESNRRVCQNGMLKALENADGFVFISKSARNEFERILPGWLDAVDKPWVVTPLASRRTLRETSPAGVPAHWLAVGSLEPRKNYGTMLDAIEQYWKQSTQRLPLWIVGGPGWKSDALRAQIGAMSLRGMVKYLGYVTDSELHNLYANAAALIFPSWYEGFGLPVLEAMSVGCPAIVSNRTSMPEVGGEAAMYMEPTDTGRLVELMLRLEMDSVARANLVQAGRARAAQFSWKDTAEQTLEFYHRVKCG
jgi:glycosyltransferase involved in cell wall biosynthesis